MLLVLFPLMNNDNRSVSLGCSLVVGTSCGRYVSHENRCDATILKMCGGNVMR